jgi:phosphoglycolate phosphatase
VVTGKNTRDARRTLDALGLEVDSVEGSLFGAGKGTALASFGAAAYVGDHVADIEAARAGGVVSVAVATGLYPVGELRDHGADVVLGDLTEFTEWFDGWRTPASLV